MKKQIQVLLASLVLAPLALAGAPQEKMVGTVDAQPSAPAQRQPDASVHCLRHTGSRIQRMRTARQRRDSQNTDKNDCVMLAGRSYSREDIERTGALDLLDALRKLDPAIH
ncbi:MAG: hypothetical protein Q4B94_04355 [Pseudomonadota bacterium]|nr:hypothetical protein [Pseudomonadota bacterium]